MATITTNTTTASVTPSASPAMDDLALVVVGPDTEESWRVLAQEVWGQGPVATIPQFKECGRVVVLSKRPVPAADRATPSEGKEGEGKAEGGDASDDATAIAGTAEAATSTSDKR